MTRTLDFPAISSSPQAFRSSVLIDADAGPSPWAMWAAMFTNSASVTFFPIDQLDAATVEIMVKKLRENGVTIRGDAA
jgi:hypothetical protein